MQRLLALRWNASEADAVVAIFRGGQLRIEDAWRIDLQTPSNETAPQATPPQQLVAALKPRQLGRIPTVVVLDRNSVELRYLTLPVVPDEELPDLVRFQAMRQFNSLEEDGPLDFLPLDHQADEQRHVLAATVPAALLGDIRQLCDGAGLRLTRLVLRPCAAASLIMRRLSVQSTGCRLLVNLDNRDADLAVILDGRVSYLRQMHFEDGPLDGPTARPGLLQELRRTIAAAQNQPGSRPLDGVVLLGTSDQQAVLLAQDLSLPLEIVNPLDAVDWRTPSPREPWQSAGSLSPLLGAIWDEATASPPALDFLHPRRRQEPPSRRKTYLVAGALMMLLLGTIAVANGLRTSQLQADIQRLQAEANTLAKQAEKAEATAKTAEEIRAWTAADVNWLDELRWLSERSLSSTETMLTGLRLQASSHQREMALDGVAKDVQTISRLDHSLRDASHRLDLTSADKSNATPPYTMRFRSSLLIGEEK